MSLNKAYAVINGDKKTIYNTWKECQQAVKGVKGVQFKGFITKEAAQEWLDNYQPLKHLNDVDLSKYDYILYSDGGCRNHGNKKGKHVLATDPAAYAWALSDNDGHKKCGSGGRFGKTNNQMELAGLIMGLRFCKNKNLTSKRIMCALDSKYTLGIARGNSKPSTNKELAQMLTDLVSEFTNLDFCWIHGHTGQEGNELVDTLLNKKMNQMQHNLKAQVIMVSDRWLICDLWKDSLHSKMISYSLVTTKKVQEFRYYVLHVRHYIAVENIVSKSDDELSKILKDYLNQ